jgi:hypothetical protein
VHLVWIWPWYAGLIEFPNRWNCPAILIHDSSFISGDGSLLLGWLRSADDAYRNARQELEERRRRSQFAK